MAPIDIFKIDASPLFVRVSLVAETFGIATETLLSDCAAGRLPIRVVQFGERQLHYAHRGDVSAFIQKLEGTDATL